MAGDRPKGRIPKAIGGAELPMNHADERVEQWDDYADRSFARAIYYLDQARECYIDVLLKPYGLSTSHVAVITYLGEGHDGDTQSVIADVIGVDPATVTRVARKLEQMGYITRRVSSRDPRALHLSLTEKGWAVAKPIDEISNAWNDEIAGHLSPRRRAELLRALQRMAVRGQAACKAVKERADQTGNP